MPEIKLDEKVLAMFVDKLIADKGGDTLDAKQKETLRQELLEALDERLQQAMIRALPDAKLMELEKMLDAEASDEEIEGLFQSAGVDFDPVLRKAMSDFRDDYFTGKIKVSVKTTVMSAPGATTEMAKTAPMASTAEAVAPTAEMAAAPVAQPEVGQPAQGTTSAVPGQSDVEGVANVTNAAAQGQVLTAEPQTMAQGQVANATEQAVAQPTAPVVAQPVGQQSVATEQIAAKPVEEPLQAAPDLMSALNAATESLAAGTQPAIETQPGVVADVMVETQPGAANAGAQPGVATGLTTEGVADTTNTDLAGKEA